MQFDQLTNHDKTSFPAQFCEQDGHLSESQNSIKIITVINEWEVHVRKVNQDALACSSKLEPRISQEKFRTCKNYCGSDQNEGWGSKYFPIAICN